jgi:hypothetical protein
VKRPKPKNTPIDGRRIRAWTNEFAGYRQQIGEYAITGWLDQFEQNDRDLAARTLDVVEFFGTDRIAQSFRRGLGMVPGWHAKPSQREGQWRFVPYSLSAGRSGDSMLYQFKVANSLDGKSNEKLFVHPSKLILEKLDSEDTVVLVDDFVATGDTVIESWNDLGQLVGTAGRAYMLVVAAVREARRRVKEETDLRLVTAHELDDSHNLFSTACDRFTAAEKETLLKYNKKADAKRPRGYGECGLVVVFSHRCPNNSVPILHTSDENWEGLFPRHD